ncbi:unnamed protein product [marine sediment metagenome]|uniref:Uncharacterized protein n=1 Tax=marine sediment metagenome TaxID=412755 RepID=X1I061_9ZZZZ
MKKKFFTVLLAVVLILSFSLVTAVPVAVWLEKWGVSSLPRSLWRLI